MGNIYNILHMSTLWYFDLLKNKGKDKSPALPVPANITYVFGGVQKNCDASLELTGKRCGCE